MICSKFTTTMPRCALFFVSIIIPGTTFASPKPSAKDYQAEFAWKFHKQISSNFQTNVASSPYLISEIFTCLANVSLPSNTFSKEFQKVLLQPMTNLNHTRFDQQRERFQRRKELKIASLAAALGIANDLDKKFRSTMKHCRVYQAKIPAESDAMMTRNLNGAIKSISNNEVREFMNSFGYTNEWNFLIMNAVVMNPPWKYQFRESDTSVCPFYVSKSEEILTEFMEIKENFRYGRFPKWNLEAVEVPFKDDSPFSCVLMHSIDGSLSNMMKKFGHNRFREIFQKMKMGKTSVIVPKGSIQAQLKAGDILQHLGLKAPFTENLFKVSNAPSGVALGEFLQKVTIKFETGVGQAVENIPGRDLRNQFYAHEPFVYVIFDRQELMPIIVGNMVRLAKSNKPKSDHSRCQNEPTSARKG